MSGVKLLTQTHYWIVPGLQRLKRRSLIHAWFIFGAYMLSHSEMRMTQQGPYYSVNEAYRDSFPSRYGESSDRPGECISGHKYASRYIGSMVTDFQRTLLKGGVFLYSPTGSNPDGKQELLYEEN